MRHAALKYFNTSGLAAFLDAGFGFGLGASDVSTRSQSLVAQHTQGFDFWALASTFAVLEYLDIAGARHAALVDRLFFFYFGAPQHQQFADVLDGGSVQFGRQNLEHGFSGGAVVRKDAHLD